MAAVKGPGLAEIFNGEENLKIHLFLRRKIASLKTNSNFAPDEFLFRMTYFQGLLDIL